MMKTIGTVSVITEVNTDDGLSGNNVSKIASTNKLNNIYTKLQSKTKDLGMKCRLVSVDYIVHNNLRKYDKRCVVVEAVGVFESELHSTQEALEAILDEFEYRITG